MTSLTHNNNNIDASPNTMIHLGLNGMHDDTKNSAPIPINRLNENSLDLI